MVSSKAFNARQWEQSTARTSRQSALSQIQTPALLRRAKRPGMNPACHKRLSVAEDPFTRGVPGQHSTIPQHVIVTCVPSNIHRARGAPLVSKHYTVTTVHVQAAKLSYVPARHAHETRHLSGPPGFVASDQRAFPERGRSARGFEKSIMQDSGVPDENVGTFLLLRVSLYANPVIRGNTRSRCTRNSLCAYKR